MATMGERLIIQVGSGYDAQVIREPSRIWVRLDTREPKRLIGFWSHSIQNEADIEVLSVILGWIRERAILAAKEGVRPLLAFQSAPPGWEFWPGVPEVIARSLDGKG